MKERYVICTERGAALRGYEFTGVTGSVLEYSQRNVQFISCITLIVA